MDVKYINACGFLSVYWANRRLRAYQFGYLDVAHDDQVPLPCTQAFSIQEKSNWILTKDQVMEIMAALYPDSKEDEEVEKQDEKEQEYNPAWEGQQQHEGPWDPWPNQ